MPGLTSASIPRILYLLTLRSSRLRRSHTLCLEKHTHQDMGDSHANRVQCESFARSIPVLSRRVPLAGANLRNLRVSARYHHHIKGDPEDHLKTGQGYLAPVCCFLPSVFFCIAGPVLRHDHEARSIFFIIKTDIDGINLCIV